MSKKNYFSLILILFLSNLILAETIASYGIGDWDNEKLGNHRAVLKVNADSDAVSVHIPWRRCDKYPEKKKIIIKGPNGEDVNNLKILEFNHIYSDIVFQPKSKGLYYLYYMPYEYKGKWYHPTTVYLRPDYDPDKKWLEKNGISDKSSLKDFPQAELIQLQAYHKFHSFYPMEVIATEDEIKQLINPKRDKKFVVFPEDREHPIRMRKYLPYRWIRRGLTDKFRVEAKRNEYYCFQAGIYALKDIADLEIKFTDLTSTSGEIIEADKLTCFNTGGTDWLGREFQKTVNAKKGNVQPVWIGIDISKDTEPAVYKGKIKFSFAGTETQSIELTLKIEDEICENRGYDDLKKHARLNWLNSTLGLDDSVIEPFKAVKVNDSDIEILGRKIKLDDTGLPAKIQSTFPDTVDSVTGEVTDILAGPIEFKLKVGEKTFNIRNSRSKKTEVFPAKAEFKADGKLGCIDIDLKSYIEQDGYLDYKVTFTARENTRADNLYLEIPLNKKIAEYMMGLGKRGGYRPERWHWDWSSMVANNNLWLGTVNAGLHLKLKNYYDQWVMGGYHGGNIPQWYNDNKGGLDVFEKDGKVLVRAYTGQKEFEKNEKLNLRFSLLVTPFKPLDKDHWDWRYCHDYHDLWPLENIVKSGTKIINVHQGNHLNPHINYPFLTAAEIKNYVQKAKSKAIDKVKIYYTVRELSNHAREIWAFRSLDGEIYLQGKGFVLADEFEENKQKNKLPSTGNSWLCEHLRDDYIPAWHDPLKNLGRPWDAAIATTGLSSFHNYYLEGLSWLIEKTGIGGLYLDGIGYDREIMKRLRKAMDYTKPGCLLDFHSGNPFQQERGGINPASLYMEHLPYVNSLWFGEGYKYEEVSPDYWLVEMSGIPFGLFGEMLHLGGNPWRGMIYGMTNRLRWSGDPVEIWKLWDKFGIKQADMIGYWSERCPVKTSHKDILATAYVKEDKALFSIASWAEKDEKVTLDIDSDKLPFGLEGKKLYALKIPGFQQEAEFAVTDEIPVPESRGWLLILK